MTSPIQFRFSAPGKIILFGEHSVVHKRTAVATTINKRTMVTFTQKKKKKVSIKMSQVGLDQCFDINQIDDILHKPIPVNNNAQFSLAEPKRINHDMFLEEISRDISSIATQPLDIRQTSALKSVMYLLRGILGSLNVPLRGFCIELSSQLSMGAGMGSSASFSVCLSAGFLHYVRRLFKQSASGLINVCKENIEPFMMDLDEPINGFSNMEKEIVNSWAYALEKIMHGSPSGLDNTICTYGYLIEMNRNSKQGNGKIFNIFKKSPELRIILVDTGVSRVTANLVKKVNALKSIHPQIVENILNAMGDIAEKASDTLQELSCGSSALERRKKFMILEDLIDINQGLLKTLGVSHPLLDTICEISIKYGLHSKLTGAGGGGYAFTLIPTDFDELQVSGYCEQLMNLGLQVMDVKLGTDGIRFE